jgi:hypothetical protein
MVANHASPEHRRTPSNHAFLQPRCTDSLVSNKFWVPFGFTGRNAPLELTKCHLVAACHFNDFNGCYELEKKARQLGADTEILKNPPLIDQMSELHTGFCRRTSYTNSSENATFCCLRRQRGTGFARIDIDINIYIYNYIYTYVCRSADYMRVCLHLYKWCVSKQVVHIWSR